MGEQEQDEPSFVLLAPLPWAARAVCGPLGVMHHLIPKDALWLLTLCLLRIPPLLSLTRTGFSIPPGPWQ